ncbi:MAG: hypothetical protein ABJB47_06340, partial [Actinomycetota bacterium]
MTYQPQRPWPSAPRHAATGIPATGILATARRPAARPAAASRACHAERPPYPGGPSQAAGIAANERLTTVTGALLLILFAAEGVTILSVHRLLTLHFVLGMLLAGPVALKIGSTSYRIGRYYTGAPAYVRKGPPPTLLRLLGPVVVITSCGVIGTGIMLAFTGPGPGPWLLAHKALFV